MTLRYALLLLPVSFVVIFAVYGSRKPDNKNFESAREVVALREIGHKLLLSAGDQSTRVLPVRQVSTGRYEIHFERELHISADSFVTIVSRSLNDRLHLSDFTANIVSCNSREVVYGFVTSGDSTGNIVPCLERSLPKGCYFTEVIFSTGTEQRNNYYLPVLFLTLALATFFIWPKLKKKDKPEAETAAQSQSKETIQIGAYEFDFSRQHLLYNGVKTDLTRKEAELLYMLTSHANEVVEREMLQKKIWEDDGVIVTRSLDMFVSRLRKKLSADANVKIVNIHRKGYKLEISS